MLESLDKELFLFINGLHAPAFDILMWHISGKWIWIPLYGVILYFIIKKHGLQSLFYITAIIISIVAADQISVLIKNSVERFRPTHNPDIESLVHFIRDYKGGSYGFVSSHAANTFALAVLTLKIFQQKWITISILCWAVLVSYSRIYLGVHYPGDILGGAILGGTIGYIMYRIAKIIEVKHKTG